MMVGRTTICYGFRCISLEDSGPMNPSLAGTFRWLAADSDGIDHQEIKFDLGFSISERRLKAPLLHKALSRHVRTEAW